MLHIDVELVYDKWEVKSCTTASSFLVHSV